jgi:uncharacterized membrane protein HdeD (DUF308 family)
MTSWQTVASAVWWMVLLRGLLAVLFGLVALLTPGIALLTLVFVFGFYALLDGVVAVVVGIRMRSTLEHWGWVVVQGVVSVLAGLAALVWPGLTALTLLVIVGVWAIALGVAEIAEAFGARRRGTPAWGWTLAAGVLGVLFGIALIVQPAAGILALLWLLGTFALVVGVVLIVWAFRIRSAVRSALPR